MIGQLDATIGNRTDQDVYGTACLQADGGWLVQLRQDLENVY